jgi:ABC-2 type transport system permease protein
MERKNFSGWQDVFSFTIKQTTKGKSFKIATFTLAFLLFAILFIVNILTATFSDKDKVSPITVVHVLDESGFSPTDFSTIGLYGNKAFSKVSFVNVDGKTFDEAKNDMDKVSNTEVLLHIVKTDEGFSMSLLIPSSSSIKKNDGQKLVKQLVPFFEMNKLTQVGLSEVQMVSINMPITTKLTTAGEAEESIGETLIKMLAPMILSLILYMMLLLYGQSICKSIIMEKTSKLMELLLTSVRPYSIITGKILAMTCLAIFQFIVWIGSGVVGFLVGNYVTKQMYPEYNNTISSVLNLLRENTSASAFSLTTIIFAFLILSVGFLFWSVIAGMVGAVLNKAEDLQQGMGFYLIPVLLSFFAAYYIPLNGGEALTNIVRYVPFTVPFLVPAELIIGNVSILQGCISLAILLVTTVVFILLTGKIYKGMVLYTGNKLTPKNLLSMLRAK